MKVLITGGAGFIGRWVTKYMVEGGDMTPEFRFMPADVRVLDNLESGCFLNLEELMENPFFKGLHTEDIRDKAAVERIFKTGFDICFHLAASINVQESLDNPWKFFENDVMGTYNLLEESLKYGTKFVFVSTCMVYERAFDDEGIKEEHLLRCKSPYAASKLAAEKMVESFYLSHGLPVTILRPFNTYGPYQKTNGEGGVVAKFIKNKLDGKPLVVYGDGTQTRDLLYVEDCARFIVMAGLSDKCVGHVLNCGLGRDIPVNDLARLISRNKTKVKNVDHIHPEAEIQRLLCNCSKARELLGWSPRVSLKEGIAVTEKWLRMRDTDTPTRENK